MAKFSFSWVDLAVVLLIIAGIIRGRKRGMSEELLDVVKWLGIVAVGAYVYLPGGEFLAQMTPFSRLSCFVAVYVLVIIIFQTAFMLLRHSLGEKPVGTDTFGGAEYYLGMGAGAVRYACVIVTALALLNARHYSAEEIRRDDIYQEWNYGSIRLPKFYAFQREIFESAYTGKYARRYAPMLLIVPTQPEDKGLNRSGIANARERQFNETLAKP